MPKKPLKLPPWDPLHYNTPVMEYVAASFPIWSDDHLLVINKPAGLLSLPHGYEPHLPHLRAILEPHFGRLWITHRLDHETSGVMALARNPAAHRHLNTQFQERRVHKSYHALILGRPDWEKRTFDHPLRPDGDRRHRTILDARRGKPALTQVRVLRRFDLLTLVEAAPETGRRHQIRAHLAAEGYPLVSDPLYGDPSHPAHALLPRLGLHALSLALEHPVTSEARTFRAPYPQDFDSLLRKLET